MEFKLINEYNDSVSLEEQILINRGIPKDEIHHFLNPSDEDINSPRALGEEKMKKALEELIKVVQNNKRVLCIVDSDCDGYTSSAVLINYLHELFPAWCENNVSYFHHLSKQHGLKDAIEEAEKYDLIFCPDSASSDITQHQVLYEKHIPVIVLDHHLTDLKVEEKDHYPYAIVINSQYENYSNPELSGVGVTWQFCKYIDSVLGKNIADKFLDLVAVGLVGDLMSLKSIETKYLIYKGLHQIENPLIDGMIEMNSYSMRGKIIPSLIAFYVVPYINAITRSGTIQEKSLVFNALLVFKAKEKILSTKRGHKIGEYETILSQALRTLVNVKKRQSKTQEDNIVYVENIIEEKNLNDHKFICVAIEANKIQSEQKGLIAQNIATKHQKPCCILTLNEGKYEGSARGYERYGIHDFKKLCEQTNEINYAQGHSNAFGLSIDKEKLENFISKIDLYLKNIKEESSYLVDKIYYDKKISPDDILTIAELDDLWGKDIEEPLIAIESLKFSKDMVSMLSKDKNPTIKITLPNGIVLMKFKSSEEEYLSLCADGYAELNIVGTCNKNQWGGKITPQIFITDYEIKNITDFYF